MPVPAIQEYPGIPLPGTVMAGFTALAASLIAYNASTFASGFVMEDGNGNFAGTWQRSRSRSTVRAIASGMQQISQRSHDMAGAQNSVHSYEHMGAPAEHESAS